MGNIGILISSVLVFVAAILIWVPFGLDWSVRKKRTTLGLSYAIIIVLIAVVIFLSVNDQFPVFFTSQGSTFVRKIVLALSAIILITSCTLFGWKYVQTKSLTVYWYTLGLILFTISLVGLVYTVKIGEAVNWCGRIGLYLTGIYFLIAVFSANFVNRETGLAEKWAIAFRTSRKQNAILLSNMLNGVAYCRIVIDKNGKPTNFVYLDINQAFEKINGLKREDVIGKLATDVIPGIERDSTDWFSIYGHVALSETPTTFDAYSNSLKRWFHISAYSPKKTYFVSISEDITERIKAEEALRDAEEKAKDLIQFSPTGIYEISFIPPRFTKVNDAMCRILGYSREELLSFDPERILDGESGQRFRERIRRQLSGENVDDTIEYTVRTKDGRTIFAILNTRPINQDGKPVGAFVVAHDVTESHAREEELRRSNAELQQFAYVASHDLQEPLRMVINYLSLLERRNQGKLDLKSLEYIEFAIEGGERMRRLIDDLLEYSRVETKGVEFAQVDMNLVVETALSNLKATADEVNAEITAGPLPSIMADSSQMVQLIQNLVGNSLKFHSKEKPMIQISATQENKEWVFSVKDNGIGMNMEYADKIFQMFQRLHTKDQYPGTGVGLAISKKIVERHGGRIWVESEEGKGATFFFTIPKAMELNCA